MRHCHAGWAAFSLLLVAGLAVRLVLLPWTAGSDVVQFASFADTFLRHGLEFYKYADGREYEQEGWPYNWPYLYGPLLIVALAPIRAAFPTPVRFFWSSGNYYVYAPLDWVAACKSLFVAFDTASAVAIFEVLRRRRGMAWGLAGLAAYYLSPASIYVSSVYGMFDPIPLLLMIAGAWAVDRAEGESSALLGLGLAGLAAFSKQNFAPASVLLLAYAALRARSAKSAAKLIAAFVAPSLALLAPFQLAYPGTLMSMVSMGLGASSPGYTYPIVYSFNGISSVATYMHDKTGGDYLWAVSYWWIPFSALMALALSAAFFKRGRLSALDAAALGYLAFVAAYWRVNYQYLPPAVALLILSSVGFSEGSGLGALLYAFYVSLWPIIFPTSWWAHVHIETPNTALWRAMDSLSLMIFDEGVYVIYSVGLTVLSYVVFALLIQRALLDSGRSPSAVLPQAR